MTDQVLIPADIVRWIRDRAQDPSEENRRLVVDNVASRLLLSKEEADAAVAMCGYPRVPTDIVAKLRSIGSVAQRADATVFLAERATIASRAAEEIERLRTALANFADPANWSDEVGRLQWMGKHHAVEYARSVLDD